MSVINKMLQDLEQRQQPDLAVSKQKQAPQQGNGRTSYYVGFALLAGLMLIGVLLFSFSRPHQQSSGAQVQQTATIDQGASGEQLQPVVSFSQQNEVDDAGPTLLMGDERRVHRVRAHRCCAKSHISCHSGHCSGPGLVVLSPRPATDGSSDSGDHCAHYIPLGKLP